MVGKTFAHYAVLEKAALVAWVSSFVRATNLHAT